MVGIYIHVPFCDRKCPYCDFYSVHPNEDLMDRYTSKLQEVIAACSSRKELAQTVYFGGGTPNLIGAKRLSDILKTVRETFQLTANCEITMEMNPTSLDSEFLQAIRLSGVNRLSIGMQSAHSSELEFLGRRHSRLDVTNAVISSRACGFDNISLDLMMALPNSSTENLSKSIQFAASLDVDHISTYLLKVEPGTPFDARKVQVPEDDEAAEIYQHAVEELSANGYQQYEISNFAKPNKESHHNLLYWNYENYLGFGPSAHSFYHGERYFYPRSLESFLKLPNIESEGITESFSEFAMLALRLSTGLRLVNCKAKFPYGEENFKKVLKIAKSLPNHLVNWSDHYVSFSPEGFLISNLLIVKLLATGED